MAAVNIPQAHVTNLAYKIGIPFEIVPSNVTFGTCGVGNNSNVAAGCRNTINVNGSPPVRGDADRHMVPPIAYLGCSSYLLNVFGTVSVGKFKIALVRKKTKTAASCLFSVIKIENALKVGTIHIGHIDPGLNRDIA